MNDNDESRTSWKVSLPCTKAEAESLQDDIGPLALLDPPPVLIASEPDPAQSPETAQSDMWRMDAYFEDDPTPASLDLLARLVPSAAGVALHAERLPDQDWVTLSQAGLEPITEGRFHVHTAAHADTVPAGSTAFRIEASRAFGTGQHETTAGCLAMLDRLATRGAHFRNALDIGTGTGILAFAIARTWPARVIASDIDPESIEVAAENAAANGLASGRGPHRIELVVASGMAHRRLAARGPYDLVTANILAGPLIALSPAIAPAVAPGGTLILSGLLTVQAEAVAAAYVARGFRLAERLDRGDWSVLRLVRRRTTAFRKAR